MSRNPAYIFHSTGGRNRGTCPPNIFSEGSPSPHKIPSRKKNRREQSRKKERKKMKKPSQIVHRPSRKHESKPMSFPVFEEVTHLNPKCFVPVRVPHQNFRAFAATVPLWPFVFSFELISNCSLTLSD